MTVASQDADATLPALYALGRPVRGLEVGGGGLEESLLALTSGAGDDGGGGGAGASTSPHAMTERVG